MTGLVRIIAHWSAGRYTASKIDRDHYHFIYEGDGREVAGIHTPEDNISAKDGKYAAHTRGCNTGSIGVAVACMWNAKEGAHGSQPMTEAQFEAMCRGIARLCMRYKIPVTPRTVLSHAEVQPTLGIKQNGKWDFTELSFSPSLKGHKACGDFMRSRVSAYMVAPAINPKPVAPVKPVSPPPAPVTPAKPETPPAKPAGGFWHAIGQAILMLLKGTRK